MSIHHFTKIFIFSFLFIFSITAWAQTDVAYDKYGGVYHHYIQGNSIYTPAPAGYKAFYISHVGRHGSRYPVDEHYIDNGKGPLTKCLHEGILKEPGKKMLKGFEKLDSISKGLYGFLDKRGAQEHKEIAQRMYDNFHDVFKNLERDSIFVQSTHRQRCLMSAWNFCTTLQANVPNMKMELVAGEKYYDILANAETKEIGAHNKIYNEYSDTYAAKHFDFDKFASRLFTNQKKARSFFRNDRTMLETMYTNGAVAKYLGINEIYDVLLPEEFEFAARNYSGKMNCQHCGSKENGSFRVPYAKPLLKDIINRADAALKGNHIAADLRFSHDTGMMPFFAFIGLNGFDGNYSYDEACEKWDATTLMCMATNLQMIFYRNPEGNILVKLIHNERETNIPKLGKGPFYTWKEMRDYLQNLCN